MIFQKGKSNLAKGNIAQLIMSYAKETLLIWFYNIRQVAAHIVKLVLLVHLGSPFWERGGCRRSAMVPFKRATVVSYRHSIVTTALSNIWMSPTLKSTGGGSHWDKIWERVDWCKSNFNKIWERHGTVVCKRNCIDNIYHLCTMHERRVKKIHSMFKPKSNLVQ